MYCISFVAIHCQTFNITLCYMPFVPICSYQALNTCAGAFLQNRCTYLMRVNCLFFLTTTLSSVRFVGATLRMVRAQAEQAQATAAVLRDQVNAQLQRAFI